MNNTFTTARNPRPAPPDPFALLDHLPREEWDMAFFAFHFVIRRTDVRPAQIVEWVRRGLQSTIAEMERASARLPGLTPYIEARRRISRALEEHPDAAEAFARHVQEIAILLEVEREVRGGQAR
jgi:hypothetical protein